MSWGISLKDPTGLPCVSFSSSQKEASEGSFLTAENLSLLSGGEEQEGVSGRGKGEARRQPDLKQNGAQGGP